MSLGNPWSPAVAIQLTGANTTASVNTSFAFPMGSDVWVVNPNTASVAFITLSATNTQPTVAIGGGVSIPPGEGMLLKAPWQGANGQIGYIAAVMNTGANTTTLFANAGYGSSAR